jgi:hypothetical protein
MSQPPALGIGIGIGEVWAYRDKQNAPLLEVQVKAIRTTYPPRAKVEFLATSFAGETTWVPAGRLKCLWDEREELLAVEAAWDDLHGDGRPLTHEAEAVLYLFWEVEPELISLHHVGTMGIGEITDVDRLAEILEWPVSDITESPGSLRDGDLIRVRWSLTHRIAEALARKYPERAFRLVDRERKSLHTFIEEHIEERTMSSPWAKEEVIRADVEKRLEKHWAPWDHIAAWIGVEEEIRVREHEDLVRRFDRLARLAREAAPLLRARRTISANRLAHEMEALAKSSPPEYAESPQEVRKGPNSSND